jgi:hypothetical protein
MTRYEFTNFTEESFTGRYGGVDYTFAPDETRSFDPDKHYMLLLMAKQLADRELAKSVKSVGRDPKDMETWGKSLDSHGKPFTVTSEMRKTLMRQAVGNLVDVPIPVPEQDASEAGSTKETTQDVKVLQDQVRELTETVQALTSALKTQPQAANRPLEAPVSQPVTEPRGISRDVLTSMASDMGITGTERMTKEELIHAVSSRQAQI